MSRFVYLRQFSSIDGHDFFNLSLQQRLFLSAVLTKYRCDDKRTIAEIIFGYGDFWTRANFKDYDSLITSVIDNELGTLTDYIKRNAKALDENSKRHASTEERYLIKGIQIDQAQLFVMRNGDGHTDENGNKSGLSQIAWKAFALAASLSNLAVPQWRMLHIYNWVADTITYEKILKVNKTLLKRNIEKWLRMVKISGEFDNKTNTFLVDTKKFQIDYKKKNGDCYIRGCSVKPGQSKEKQKFIEALEKKTVEA
ncbi:MAG: hypothetical protein II256_00930 [Bacteroidales bacterium]|nr:hypothetical protein [Bacteroidales bacterium]